MPGNEPLPHLDESGRPTLKTVAALAGVHVSTMSRVLSASYPPERPPAARTTIDRIEVIAREVGFGKNPHAAGLRTSRSHLVGVLVPHLTDIVLSTIYDGIGAQARRLGYQTFVTNTHDEVGLRAEAAEMLLARRVDGLILGDAAVTGDELAADLTRRDVPFVLASRRSDDFPSVTCDDVLGGRMAAEHLLERGHRRVGVLAGTLRASTGLDRTLGFVKRPRKRRLRNRRRSDHPLTVRCQQWPRSSRRTAAQPSSDHGDLRSQRLHGHRCLRRCACTRTRSRHRCRRRGLQRHPGRRTAADPDDLRAITHARHRGSGNGHAPATPQRRHAVIAKTHTNAASP